jgi:hypothetical protein
MMKAVRTSTSFAFLAGSLCALACGGREPDNTDDGVGSITVTAEGGTSNTDDTGPMKFDVEGEDETAGGSAEEGEGEGCEKVDFVFVIDSSPSMFDEQAALLASFPGFINAIEQTLMLNDFQVMVVDAGATAGAGCDSTLGAGRVSSGTGQDCALVGGNRYATQDQPDLTAAFSCMANRGATGPGNEQTMDSLLNGIGPLSAGGQCNDGFIRDDAVLVVTIVTDEEDDPNDTVPVPAWDGTCEPADADTNSVGSPMTWYDQIVNIKNNQSKAAVVLSLIGDCDEAGNCGGIVFDQLNPQATTGAEPAPRLRQFTNLWDFGSIGPVCANDYTPFFEAAVSVIGSACDDFMPPG